MLRRPFKPNWGKFLPFIGFHISAVIACALVGFTWRWWALCVGLYVLRVFGTTAGYHRYFSHRSFKTSRPMQFALACLANLSLMRGPLTWASHHRYHHKVADTEDDLHSPRQRGFWFSHCLWFASREYDETKLIDVKDLEKFPELVFINRHYYLPAYTLALVLYLAGGWPWFAWGFLASTVLAWHCIFMINSGAHRFGQRRFGTADDSRNNLLLAVLLLGEGWHNNHHHYMHSARQGFRWWEIDLTYYGLWALSKVGLIWDLQPPPKDQLGRA
jgi:stearoyl-CoA desaturase (delta-9 desaturase)